MIWENRSTVTPLISWDNELTGALAKVVDLMHKPQFQVYLAEIFGRAQALVRGVPADTTLEEFCQLLRQSEPVAQRLLALKVRKAVGGAGDSAPAMAAHIFKEFFEALVKGRSRYFQRRREAGLPERPASTNDCSLAKAVDAFVLDAPFGNWEVILSLAVAGVETAAAAEEAARLAELMDGMCITD